MITFHACQFAGLILASEPSPQVSSLSAEALDAAVDSAGQADLNRTISTLESAIAEIVRQPEVILTEPEIEGKLARARAVLAWAHLAAGDEATATQVLDDAIRSVDDGHLELEGLGSELQELYVRRLRSCDPVALGPSTFDAKFAVSTLRYDESQKLKRAGAILLGFGAHQTTIGIAGLAVFLDGYINHRGEIFNGTLLGGALMGFGLPGVFMLIGGGLTYHKGKRTRYQTSMPVPIVSRHTAGIAWGLRF